MTLIGWKYQRLPSFLKTKVRASSRANSSNSNDGNDDSFIRNCFRDSIWNKYNATSDSTASSSFSSSCAKALPLYASTFLAVESIKSRKQVRQQEEEEARPLTVALELPLHPPLKKESHPSAVPTIRHFLEESISEGGKIQDWTAFQLHSLSSESIANV